MFSSGCPNTIAQVNALCIGPNLILNSKKGNKKQYHSNWSSKLCAKFILNVDQLLEEDKKEKNDVC